MCRQTENNRKQGRAVPGTREDWTSCTRLVEILLHENKMTELIHPCTQLLRADTRGDAMVIPKRTVSDGGLDLIAKWEGFREHLYNDVADHCTIGYGHLVHKGKCNGSEPPEFKSGIKEPRAREFLIADAQKAAKAVSDLVQVPLTQDQFDALTSFVFNFSRKKFAGSTLLEKLNSGDYASVPSELARWKHAGGAVSQGLVNRRKDEADLFA